MVSVAMQSHASSSSLFPASLVFARGSVALFPPSVDLVPFLFDLFHPYVAFVPRLFLHVVPPSFARFFVLASLVDSI